MPSKNRKGSNASGQKNDLTRTQKAAIVEANAVSGAVPQGEVDPVVAAASADAPTESEVEQSTDPVNLSGVIDFSYKNEDTKQVVKAKLPEHLRINALRALEAAIPATAAIQAATKIADDNRAAIEKSVLDLSVESLKVTMRGDGRPDFDGASALFLGVARWAEQTCGSAWEKQPENKGKKFVITKMAQPWVAAVSAIKTGWDSKKGEPVNLLNRLSRDKTDGTKEDLGLEYPTIASVRTRNNVRRAETASIPASRQMHGLASSSVRFFIAIQAFVEVCNTMTETELDTIAAEGLVKLAQDMVERKKEKAGPAVADARATAMRGGSR